MCATDYDDRISEHLRSTTTNTSPGTVDSAVATDEQTRSLHTDKVTAAREALSIRGELNDFFGIAMGIELFAWIAAAGGEVQRAARLIGASGRLWEPIGTLLYGSKSYQGFHDDCVRRVRRHLGTRAYQHALRCGQKMGMDELIAYACTTPDAAHPEPATTDPTLTPREREIAALIAQGRTNKDIAETLLITQRTVEGHVQHICIKLNFTTRVQIATWVTENPSPPSTTALEKHDHRQGDQSQETGRPHAP